jgi:hypothetical protein
LQAHFAESLLSRLEAGYGQADALAATEKEFGKANRLVNQIAAPHLRKCRSRAFWTPFIAVNCYLSLVFVLSYAVGGVGGPGGVLISLLAITILCLTVWFGCKSRVLGWLEAAGGTLAGIGVGVLIMGLYWIPVADVGGAPAWKAKELFLGTPAFSDEQNRAFDAWASAGWQAFRDPQKPVPMTYTQGVQYLAPKADPFDHAWPAVSPTDGHVLMEFVSRSEAQSRWRDAYRDIAERASIAKYETQLRRSVVQGYQAPYVSKVKDIGLMFWPLNWGALAGFTWASFMFGSFASQLVRMNRGRGRRWGSDVLGE